MDKLIGKETANEKPTANEKVDEIWPFVEDRLNTPVPTYVKNILKVSGYNNGITISSMVEEDITYCEAEVRNGSVSKFLVDSKGNEKDFFEGSTKDVKNFEFSRGHKKFLLFIVDFVKNHLEENGVDLFSLTKKTSKKSVKIASQNAGQRLVLTSRKKKNLNVHPLIEFAIGTKLENYENSSLVPEELILEHRKVLMTKAITSLIKITPKKLEKDIESIKEEISCNFLTFEIKQDDKSYASVLCVYCKQPIAVFHRPTTSNPFLWKTTNFNRHLTQFHSESDTNELSLKTKKFNDSTVKESDDEVPENISSTKCKLDDVGLKPEVPILAESKIEAVKSVVKFPSWCQQVPILKNGHKHSCGKQFIITENTCAFDTIFNSFACFYFDNLHVREQINTSESKISELIKALFSCASKPLIKSSERNHDLQQIYADRNVFLNELYSKWCKDYIKKEIKCTYINCKSGIGSLFAQICLTADNNFASAIEERKCNVCKTVKSKILPFLTTDNINLAKLNDCINFDFSYKSCFVCKNDCEMKKYYNNIVVVEVEPKYKNQQNKQIAIKDVCPTLHIDNTEYALCAIMHHTNTSEHFIAYILRLDNNWKCYDDLNKTEKDTDASTKINPFMLCYISRKRKIDFENLPFLSENKCKTSVKHSTCSERNAETEAETYIKTETKTESKTEVKTGAETDTKTSGKTSAETCAEIHSRSKHGLQLVTDQKTDSKRLTKKRKRNSSKNRKKQKLGSDTKQIKKPWRY